MYPSLVILRAFLCLCYQDNFKFSTGSGAAQSCRPIPARGRSGFAQALSQNKATRAEKTPWWHLVARQGRTQGGWWLLWIVTLN